MPRLEYDPSMHEKMRTQDPANVAELLTAAGRVLGMSSVGLAQILDSSRRSVSRWMLEGTRLPKDDVEALARAVYPKDRELAARIAALSEATLVSLGIERPPPAAKPQPARVAAPPPPPPSPHLASAIVCAAADRADISPRAMRPALRAAIATARAAGLTLEALESLLAPTKRKRP